VQSVSWFFFLRLVSFFVGSPLLSSRTSNKSIFIYTNIQAKVPPSSSDVRWVAGEPAECELVLYTPRGIDATLGALALDTRPLGRIQCDAPRIRVRGGQRPRKVRISLLAPVPSLYTSTSNTGGKNDGETEVFKLEIDQVLLWFKEYPLPCPLACPAVLDDASVEDNADNVPVVTLVPPLPILTLSLAPSISECVLLDGQSATFTLSLRNASIYDITRLRCSGWPQPSTDVYHPDDVTVSCPQLLEIENLKLAAGQEITIPVTIQGRLFGSSSGSAASNAANSAATTAPTSTSFDSPSGPFLPPSAGSTRKCAFRVTYGSSSSSPSHSSEWEREANLEFTVVVQPSVALTAVRAGRRTGSLFADVWNSGTQTCHMNDVALDPNSCSSFAVNEVPVLQDADLWEKCHTVHDSKGRPVKLHHEDVRRVLAHLSSHLDLQWSSSLGHQGLITRRGALVTVDLTRHVLQPMFELMISVPGLSVTGGLSQAVVGQMMRIEYRVTLSVPEKCEAMLAAAAEKDVNVVLTISVDGSACPLVHGKCKALLSLKELLASRSYQGVFGVVATEAGFVQINGSCCGNWETAVRVPDAEDEALQEEEKVDAVNVRTSFHSNDIQIVVSHV
jgi:hypothetical protein